MAVAATGVSNLKFRPNDAATRNGFEHFYQLEYDQAVSDFEAAVKTHPDDPLAANHLLSGVLFRALYNVGALDTELYAKNGFLTSKQFPLDPKEQARIKELIARALQLSEQRLKANPNDVDALYARGATRGMRSTYIGLIEKAWFAALRNAVGARHDHERVLELDPNYVDAKMVVGIHNYVIGSISWPIKVAASVVGLSGSKSKGIEYLYAAGQGGGETSVDARVALSLFLRREQRYPEALKLVGGLLAEFPRNFLFALEHANLLNAAGHGPEAIAAFRKLLDDGKAGAFAKSRLEMAYYGLGESLRGQKDYRPAAEAYDTVLQFKEADPDLRQRASLAAGEMYDAIQNRDQALRRYQEVIASDSASDHAELARKHIKDPYRVR
ncbi:MAG: tetratricopeptide repeat protein [Terriglobales bacterium]